LRAFGLCRVVLRGMRICSLDVETTGFDPKDNEVIEVGFVVAQVDNTGWQIEKRFSQVIKPGRKVPAKILGLTGITEDELSTAQPLDNFRADIQEALTGSVFVGHNVNLDIAFLQKEGFVVPEANIDTLDLAHVLLPTGESFNLQNLMHSLGLPQVGSHRAQADAETSLELLKVLHAHFVSLPSSVKERMQGVSGFVNPAWVEFFAITGRSKAIQLPSSPLVLEVGTTETHIKTAGLYQLPFRAPLLSAGINFAAKQPSLLVVPDQKQVLAIERAGLAESVISGEMAFDPTGLARLVEIAETDAQAAKLALQVMVWQAVNWQTKSLADICPVFMGQFLRSLLTQKDVMLPNSAQLVCDYPTFVALAKHPTSLSNRDIVVVQAENFEKYITDTQSLRVSWGSLVKQLQRSMYSDNAAIGEQEAAENLIASVDLFFGLLLTKAKKFTKSETQVFGSELVLDSYTFNQLKAAAGKLVKNLRNFADNFRPGLAKASNAIELFFNLDPKFIHVLEKDAWGCTMRSVPLHLGVLEPFSDASFFLQPELPPELAEGLADRLGTNVQGHIPMALQPEDRIPILVREPVASITEILDKIAKTKGSVVVVMPTLAQITKLYEGYFVQLQALGALFVQGFTGGSHKLFTNFQLERRSILLLTPGYFSKFKALLPVDEVIIYGWNNDEASDRLTARLYPNATPAIRKIKSVVLGLDITRLKRVELAGVPADVVQLAQGWLSEQNGFTWTTE
jgi:DNA polymerase III epsilon subunit-like protein